MKNKTAQKQDGILWAGAVFAAVATICVFLTSLKNEFLELDDLGYIVDNRFIDSLDWQTVVWAFTRFHEANWHPLTMLSLAMDRQLWGMNPAGFHLTNLLFHGGTVFLVCFIFKSILSSAALNWSERWPAGRQIVWASIAGALFFGLHPLRVESVVWASERKDVLCLFFVAAAILFHLRYAARRSLQPGKPFFRFGSYWITVLMALLALLSKPTAVSLPIVLLLIDWYPLGRMVDSNAIFRVVAEKIPLLLIAGGTAALTVKAQQEPIMLSADLTVVSRVLVSFKAAMFYLWKTIWPTGLAPYYPHPGNVSATAPGEYLAYALGVAAITVAAAYIGRRKRQWPALWLYFLVTLAPMLGIIQAGSQWMADRYSYLPSLGIALLWGAGVVWISGWLHARGLKDLAVTAVGFAAIQIVCYTLMTLWQISWWQNTETIATREIGIYPKQIGAAYFARAKYRNEAGNYFEALVDIDEALAIALRRGRTSKYSELAFTQAKILRNLKRLPDALAAVDWAIQTSEQMPRPEIFRFRDDLSLEIAGSGTDSMGSGQK
ncbi:transmembrane and TPR repeat-containing protein 4 [Geobacter sp. OR-1]|uniref:hypothetical protein n=1 Tax=Geobacter sp. OR-1 TaxID=1266765 RepID=UPI000542588B|nr:hypothetical protein [Geobacter sp. OR-1]GAM10542.1 transmembrane and TPR repeat-containing protein 4 [Geobacter sp. OR-1]